MHCHTPQILRTHSVRCLLPAIFMAAFILTSPALGQVINEDFKLLASDGAAGDFFGRSIAIDNGVVAVGVRYDNDNGTDSGSAYVFSIAKTPACPWDLDGSGSVGTSDLLELLSQWGMSGSADFDENGVVGTSDLLVLLANWGPCP